MAREQAVNLLVAGSIPVTHPKAVRQRCCFRLQSGGLVVRLHPRSPKLPSGYGVAAAPRASNPMTGVRISLPAPVRPVLWTRSFRYERRCGRFDSVTGYHAGMAEWLGTGVPLRIRESDSRCPLHRIRVEPAREGGCLQNISRAVRLRRRDPFGYVIANGKQPALQAGNAGSTPAVSTNFVPPADPGASAPNRCRAGSTPAGTTRNDRRRRNRMRAWLLSTRLRVRVPRDGPILRRRPVGRTPDSDSGNGGSRPSAVAKSVVSP